MLDECSYPQNSDVLQMDREAIALFDALHQAADNRTVEASLTYGSLNLTLGVPPLGEGDRSLVFTVNAHSLNLPNLNANLCMKIAKAEWYSRECLLKESATTEFFLSEGIAVPRIYYVDPQGRFSIKEVIEGESLTSLYMRFDDLTVRAQHSILQSLEQFFNRLLDLFRKKPEYKVSISPNNIYVLAKEGIFKDPVQFVLIDPGPSPNKKYDGFNFHKYWNVVLPDRIRKYRKTGYLQWLVPREVTQSEKDQAKEFDIFQGMKPAEIFLLLKVAKTVEFDSEEVILREGAIGENLYLILEGEVEVRKGHCSKPGFWTVRIGRGSVFGELAFLLSVPRVAMVVAATPCKLIEIERDRFDELLASNLTAPYKLIYNITTILAERLHDTTVSHQRLLESYQEMTLKGIKND